jgi:hypothetical protein
MQRRTAAVALAAALLGAAACSDDAFLTEQPFDFIGPTNFYRTAGDAVAAVNGVYASFINTSGDGYYGRNFVMLSELSTEVTTTYLSASNVRSLPDNYTHTSTHEYIETTWEGAFQAINRANAVIERVPSIDMDATLRTRIVAEAQFLRALHYFNLVGLFGGVPLRTTETSSLENIQQPRATEAEVYAQIVTDLQAAIAGLPERTAYTGADQGRASKGAARALLGKVYLQRGNTAGVAQAGDFQAAAAVLREVVSSGVYSLVAEYSHLFDMAHEQNSEVIFDIQNIRAPGLGGRIASHMSPPGSGLAASQNGSFLVEQGFLNSYHASDKRKAATWLMEYNRRPSGELVRWTLMGLNVDRPYGREMPTPRKFLDIDSPGGGQDEANYIILRYADVLLMLAEAINEVSNGPTGEAYTLVEQVRARAGLGAVPLPRGLSKQDFKNRLFEERRWELALEGPHGWFDSRRNWDWASSRIEAHMAAGRANSFRGSRYPKVFTELTDKFMLWPIPQRAIDLNPELDQNPGW